MPAVDPEISKAKLEEQVRRLTDARAIGTYHGWVIEVVDLDVFVEMRSRHDADTKYVVRLCFDDYPQRAPSLTFVNPTTRAEGKEFWPKHGAFASATSREPPQLCIAGVREFHEQLHRERPWDAELFPVIKTLEAIQAELNKQ